MLVCDSFNAPQADPQTQEGDGSPHEWFSWQLPHKQGSKQENDLV